MKIVPGIDRHPFPSAFQTAPNPNPDHHMSSSERYVKIPLCKASLAASLLLAALSLGVMLTLHFLKVPVPLSIGVITGATASYAVFEILIRKKFPAHTDA
jgi:hypothetical protein